MTKYILISTVSLLLTSCNFESLQPYVGNYVGVNSPANCTKLKIGVSDDNKRVQIILQDYGLFGAAYDFEGKDLLKTKTFEGNDPSRKLHFKTSRKIEVTEDKIVIQERTVYSGSRNYDTDWYTALIMRTQDNVVKTSRVFKGLAGAHGGEDVITSAPLNCHFKKIN